MHRRDRYGGTGAAAFAGGEGTPGPIGAVLIVICRDLGIGPGEMPPRQWLALKNAVLAYGGNLVNLLFREWGAPPQLLTPPAQDPQLPAPAAEAAPRIVTLRCPKTARHGTARVDGGWMAGSSHVEPDHDGARGG